MSLTTSGQLAIAGIGCGAFILAFLVNMLPMRTGIRATLAIAEPFGLLAAFLIANPEGSCQSDCLHRATWGFLALVAAVGWLAGFAAFALVRGLGGRFREASKP